MKSFTVSVRVIFLLIIFSSTAYAKELLLSNNKCSTHFCLYSIQYLTGKPIKSYLGNGFQKFHTQLPISKNKLPIYHSHVANSVFSLRNNRDRLIYLTRNPIELLLRTFGYKNALKHLQYMHEHNTLKNNKTDTPSQIRTITNIIKSYLAFHHYPIEQRLLLYYEDVISNPMKEMEKILNLIGERRTRLNRYAENIETIRNNARTAYTNQWDYDASHVIRSDGINPLYYQEKIASEEVEELKKWIRQVFPEPTHQYIKRFL